jgi:hypothetical protein
MCWNGVDAPLFEMEEDVEDDDVTTVTVIVPTRGVIEAYNRFDVYMDVPCPACGEDWKWGTDAVMELEHSLDCAYITWLEQDCPTPEGVIPA